MPRFSQYTRALKAAASWLIGLAIAFQAVSFSFVRQSPAAEEKTETATPSTRRVPWTTSRITGSPDPPPPYRVERTHEHLKFHQPVGMTAAPGGERMFVAELEGRIYSFRPDSEAKTAELCFDLRNEIAGAEQLYGLTFHPEFQQNRYCYLCYVLKSGLPDGTRVSRFTVTATDPPRIDPRSERQIITWLSGGHNGGCLKFGPDGYLYISTGDGTGPFPPDVLNTGQDVTDLLSSILRIDVDVEELGRAYRIPPDNPLVDHPGARGEIWSYGFRNPWKMSFDPATGDLWVGDVGWELWELIFRVERGGNYGWSIVEGRQPVQPAAPRGPTPIRPPTIDHPHTEARSITGGFVYHGRQLPELAGAYVYGDYETGKIWGLRYEQDEVTWQKELADTPLKIVTFAVDSAGELYIVDYAGTLHRLAPNTAASHPTAFPRLLSETGLFASVAEHKPARGVCAYDINVEMWADGATASRLLAVPGDGQVDAGNDPWRFPPGSVLAKTISTGGALLARPRRMETQILHFEDDVWRAYTYAWNDAQSDAELVDADGSLRIYQWEDSHAAGGARRWTWRFASRAQCLLCHNVFAGTVLAFDQLQLAGQREQSPGSHSDIGTLWHTGVLNGKSGNPTVTMPRLDDSSEEISARARAYLHANCAHCHRNGGGGTATVELDYRRPLANTGILSKPPTQGSFGIDEARILAPADPYRSVMYYRMATLGRGRMPHLGSEQVDRGGLTLVRDWIAQLKEDESFDFSVDLELLRGAGSPDPDTSNATAAVHRLLASTSGALALSDAMDAGQIPEVRRRRIVQQATTDGRPEIRCLFERFLPETERSRRLAGAVDSQQVLAMAGDRAAGERLFHDVRGVQCINCHRVGARGADVGPDLSHIGRQLDKPQLLESLLQPSKRIEPKYIAYVIETKSGTVHTGLLAGRSADAIELRDNQGKTIRLPAGDVERIAPVATSLMPELLLRDLTTQQVADLLEYLSTLK